MRAKERVFSSNGEVTEGELRDAKEVFEELDADGSGDLDKDEVRLASWFSGAVRLILTVVCVCVRSSKRCASS